jgi:hypothetical protein
VGRENETPLAPFRPIGSPISHNRRRMRRPIHLTEMGPAARQHRPDCGSGLWYRLGSDGF